MLRQHPLVRIILVALLALTLTTLPSVRADAATSGFVGSATLPGNDGFWLVTSWGDVNNYGSAKHLGDMAGRALNKPIVGMAGTPTGNGYWLVASDGGIFSYGDARFFGSTGSIRLNQPIVGMASTPSGNGYWLVATDGGIFAYGDARFFGSTGSLGLNKPVVGMAPTSTGNGYWLVASDGGIFSYGDSRFFGSTGSLRLNQPIIGMTSTPGGSGYWMAAADGGIFSFGDARFYGAALANTASQAIAILKANTGGYSIVRNDGSFTSMSAAGVTTTPPLPVPAEPGNTWPLAYTENFDGTSVNTAYWGVYNGTGNEGVGFRRPSQVRVGGGELAIVGEGDTAGGICWCGPQTPPQTYGRWEVRARMDKGKGYGPAALLWPDSERWPVDGEIDISEIPGGDRTKSHFTLHYGTNNSQVGTSSTADFSQWHTFGVEWMPDHITYFLDGNAVFTTTNAAAIPHGPMHLALQNDVGANGHWIPARDASTPAQVTFHVDWVKIYR